MGCGDDDAVPDHAGKSDGCAVGSRQLGTEVDEGLDEEFGGKRVGSRDANGLGAHRSGLVEDAPLDAAATAIDGQGRRHGASLPDGDR